jgi:DNA-binding XRE family transcriptional regulator
MYDDNVKSYRKEGKMINTNKLKAKIVENGMTQEKVAKQLGITPKTFYTKMKKGVFGSDEIDQMIELLKIDNPNEYFFTQKVTQE